MKASRALEVHKVLLERLESTKTKTPVQIERIKQEKRSIEWLESDAEVSFSIGSPPNTYIVKKGTRAECEDYQDNLYSEASPGWHDASKGTNPYYEACEVTSIRL